ncbi:MAG: helix-turn-helix domain-containing protein [Rothia dentocariosa]
MKISKIEKLILIGLADRADEQGSCYPSKRDLANIAVCSEKTVQRTIQTLQEKGFMKVQARAIDGRQTSNRYFLSLDRMMQAMVFSRGDTMSPRVGHSDSPEGDTMSHEPHIGTSHLTSQKEPHTLRAAVSETAGELFEQFRAAYPASRRKTEVKQAKAQFTAALKKVDSPQVLIDAAAAYASYCQVQGTEPRYIKGMWRWLRDERWMDEYEANQQFMSKASRMRARMGVHSPWFPEATAPTGNPFQHQPASVALEAPRYDNQNILEVKAS